jgi:hypothetical protein
MTADRVQAFLSQQLGASASVRRRFVPPSLTESVSQPQNQRWRERPRCPAPRVAPERRDGVVHAIVGRVPCRRHECSARAGRTRRPRAHDHVRVRRDKAVRDSIAKWGPLAWESFPEERGMRQVGCRARHHRVFDARAVLGVVNALRFASTWPTAGPSGIDHASARHVPGSYAMVVRVMISRMALTCESRRSMLASSRQCRTAHPPFAPRANGARIRPAPTGHGIERIPLTSPQSYLLACEL